MAGTTGGKWETVVNKKKSTVTKGDVKRAQQKFIDGDSAPKVDIREALKLDKTQYASAFDEANDEEKYPSRVLLDEVRSGVNSSPKVVKKKEKKVPKAAPIFDIDLKIRTIDVADLEEKLAEIKEKFPNHQLIWLKEIAQCLQIQLSGPGVNEKGDLAFINKPDNYPLSQLSSKAYAVIKDALNDCDGKVLDSYFIYLNAALVTEVQQGHCTAANRVIIQILSKTHPNIAVDNCDEVVAGKSRHGDNYLATMWALSQTTSNLEDGLKIWWSSMFSCLEKKHHAVAALNYLRKLFRDCNVNKINQPLITPEQMVQLIEMMSAEKSPLSHTPALMDEMQSYFGHFVKLLLLDGSGEYSESAFKNILPRVRNQEDSNVLNLLCDVLVICLSTNRNCMEWWVENFIHYMRESSVLLKHMRDDPEVWRKLSSSKQYRPSYVLLKYLNMILENLDKANERGRFEKKAGFKDCRKLCTGIVRNETNRKQQSSFIWKILKSLTVLMLLFAAADVYKSGSYESSKTGFYLKHTGVEAKAKIAFQHMHTYVDIASVYLHDKVPYYYSKVSVYTDPALEVSQKYLIIAGVWLEENSRPIRAYLNEAVPPILEKISYFLSEQYQIISNWVVSLYNIHSPKLIAAVNDTYSWLYVVIPQAYNYILQVLVICATKIYELNPDFFDQALVALEDAKVYVLTQTPIVISAVWEYSVNGANATRMFLESSLEKSHVWIKEKM